MSKPTRGGQLVRDIETGHVGITTDAPRARTPRIPVQFIGRSYPVLVQLDALEVINALGVQWSS